MRIKSLADIEHLGEHAKKQIHQEIKKAQAQPLNVRAEEASHKSKTNNVKSGKTKTKKNKPAKVMKTSDGRSYCPYPNPDPSVKLHIQLLKEFGSWWCGGELVDEMILPGHEIRFRFDFCLPRYKLAIEVDGYGFHRDLKSFKKDREKQKHALKKGWVVHRLTNSDIKENFTHIIPDIKQMLKHREKTCASIKVVGKTWCEITE